MQTRTREQCSLGEFDITMTVHTATTPVAPLPGLGTGAGTRSLLLVWKELANLKLQLIGQMHTSSHLGCTRYPGSLKPAQHQYGKQFGRQPKCEQ